MEQKAEAESPRNQKNNQSERATSPRGNEEAKLELCKSPSKGQYLTSRGDRVNKNPELRKRAQNQQKTPETVRMDRIQHIRVGSDPEQLQLPQGGVKNKTQVIDRDVLQPEQEVVFEQASSEMHP